MRDLDRENAIDEALALLGCLQDLLCDAPDELQIRSTGLYHALGCVICVLKRASA